MARAHQQAQSYARNLPGEEVRDGRPPFLIVVDVGQSIALYAEFSRSGGNYIPFPDPADYRISLDDLADAEVRALLAAAWLDPLSLDPARRSARVTREIADRLARLAQSLEPGHAPAEVTGFLMRCLFTMFAEDVSLLPKGAFTQLLADSRRNAASFPPLVEQLWRTMASGDFSLARKALTAIPFYRETLRASRIRIVKDPSAAEVAAARNMIAHEPDVPILVAAIRIQTGFLVTLNRHHFIEDPEVARRSGLRIGTLGDALVWVRIEIG